MADYEAEKIIKKTAAVRKKIRQFYAEFPHYSPIQQHLIPRTVQTNRIVTNKVMKKYIDPEVAEIVDELRKNLHK